MGKLKDGVMKRGNTWSYVIRVPDPETGVSKPKWVGGFPTEAAAKAARDEARVKARRGEYIDRSRVTLGQYLDEWIEAHAVETKPKTISDYRYLVEHYIGPRLGNVRLQAVRPATLTRFYRELRESGREDGGALSFNTVNHVHTVLRKALGDAVLVDELLPFNPAERAKRPRRDNTVKMHIWTPEELRCFLRVTASHRLHALFRVAAYTGARRGELLFLRWRDVNLDEATVAVRGSANVIRGERIEGTTKGGRERVVGIDAGTVDVLRRHRSTQAEEKSSRGRGIRGQRLRVRNGIRCSALSGHAGPAHGQADPDLQRTQGRGAKAGAPATARTLSRPATCSCLDAAPCRRAGACGR